MSYLEDLFETFKEEWLNILATGLVVWILIPIFIFAISGILLLLNIIDLGSFTSFFTNALIPWWTSIMINFKKFLIEYFFSIISTLFLVHHELLESLTVRDVWRILSKNF